MRSQMAEGFYNAYTGGHRASSAGVDPTILPRFATPHPDGIAAMQELGIDISHQWPKLVTAEMLAEADEIYNMNQLDLPDFVRDCQRIVYWNVEDPFGMDTAGVRRIRDEVREHVLSLVDATKLPS